MKKHFYLLFLLTTLFSTIAVQANVITVKGYVKHPDGSPSINTEVNIAVYLTSANTTCSEQVAITNGEGFYSKEINCTGDIRRSRITVKNCDGQLLVQEKDIPSSKVLEANFVVCIAASHSCASKFTVEPLLATSTIPALSERFNSSGSEVGNDDNIVTRIWDFHDGSPLLLNRIDPMHTFPHDGMYEICLTIKTARGCESKMCKLINVQPVSPLACAARFTFEKLGPKKFRFNSNASKLAENDNIIETKWDFRDGATSNDAAPAHEFPKFGNYEVCLHIKTAKGCESKVCVVVKVEETRATENDPIIIVSLYPSPVREILKTVIYSKNNNTAATISIVNLDGINQSQQQVTLSQGYNPFTINVYHLPAGSYFYKVKTQYGIQSKLFYKL